MIAKATRGRDVIIVNTDNNNNMLDQNNQIVSSELLDITLNENKIALVSAYGELKTLANSANNELNVFAFVLIFKSRYRSPREFIDFIAMYMEEDQSQDKNICITSLDQKTLIKLNKILFLHFKLNEINIFYTSKIIKNDPIGIAVTSETQILSDDVEELEITEFQNKDNETMHINVSKNTTMYIPVWELYCSTNWLIKNIHNKWSDEIKPLVSLSEAQIHLDNIWDPTKNDALIQSYDAIFLTKFQNRMRSWIREYKYNLVLINLNITTQPNYKDFYTQGKADYIKDYGGLLRDYVNTVCDDPKFDIIKTQILKQIADCEQDAEDLLDTTKTKNKSSTLK